MHSTRPTAAEKAILVGALTPRGSAAELEDSLTELALLADTAGARVTGRVTQVLPRPSPSTYIGSGKVEEIAQRVKESNTDLVIFDDDLSPVQIRNLEKAFDCKLLDRSALILDIFARRAKTAVAKTQVELAQLDYLRTRLTRQWTHLSRQQGGIGTRGPGETQIETDRRLIGRRIATLKQRLKKIDQQRSMQRQGREQHTCVSLVGYTNAGKSTLMNKLAGSTVLAEDRLFATLDATTRMVSLAANKQILLSDTVGFIRKLPHRLIESFKSTLDEVRQSDVLVHVVSVTHRSYEDHMRVVRATLQDIGATEQPTVLVFNKIDALKESEALRAPKMAYPNAAFVSALHGTGLQELKAHLLRCIERDFVERIAYVPLSEGKTLSHIRRVADVLSEEYMEAQGSEAGATPQPVARLRFRAARKHFKELTPVLARYAALKPV